MNLNVGDIIRLKKVHPCGSSQWLILRAGMDFKLKCQGCGREIMLTRQQTEKSIHPAFRPKD